MNRRSAILALTAMTVALVCLAPRIGAYPLLVWNATASAPLGFYRIEPPIAIQVGDLLLLRPNAGSAALYAERGYLPLGVPLLKHVAAVAGMSVCEHGGHVAIEGRFAASALPTDGRGRPMVPWIGCRSLAPGEVFALNPAVRESLDGRYYGPSPMSAVLGRAVPLWTWNTR